jgi:hypothetical protein
MPPFDRRVLFDAPAEIDALKVEKEPSLANITRSVINFLNFNVRQLTNNPGGNTHARINEA